jgi:hypothetical protein
VRTRAFGFIVSRYASCLSRLVNAQREILSRLFAPCTLKILNSHQTTRSWTRFCGSVSVVALESDPEK